MRVPAAALSWAIILLAPSLALTATIHVPADQPTSRPSIDKGVVFDYLSSTYKPSSPATFALETATKTNLSPAFVRA